MIALADLPLDRERAERLADRELLPRQERVDIADARVDLPALEEDYVDERVQAVSLKASLRERTGEAPLLGVPPDLTRVEAEEPLAHRGHFFEREEAFELATEDVQRRLDLSVHRRGHPRCGESTHVRIGVGDD